MKMIRKLQIKKASTPKPDTLLGSETRFEGKVFSTQSICIEGEMEGEINCEGNVIMSPKGKIKGNIIAASVFIAGEVIGNIKAKERVEILSSGKVKGDIETPLLMIEEGAIFEGHSHMEVKETEFKPINEIREVSS